LKIAVWHNLPSGGGKRALFNHVKALNDAGHTVEAWTTDLSDRDYLPLSDLIPEHTKTIRDLIREANRITYPIRKVRAVHMILRDHCIECVEEMEQGNFDLVFANSCLLTYMPHIGIYTNIPAVLYLGEPYRRLYEAFPTNIWAAPYEDLKIIKLKRLIGDYQRNYANRIRVRKEIQAARSYSRILVNSLFSRESVLRSYGVESRVSYLGVDTDKFQSGKNGKKSYVVGLGTIAPIKGVNLAVEIIGRIPEKIRPELRWIANGLEDDYLREVQILAAELNVKFSPCIALDEGQLTDMLSHAAVMIYTSRLEPFGLAPLEANSCGTYVVAGAEGGVRESIIDQVNGTLIFNNDINDFASEIEKFITDPDFAEKMGTKARKFVAENWDLKNTSTDFIQEIEELIPD